MLFMGEEFGAATPFLFFCDFGPELATAVTEGRRKEFARFARFSSRDAQAAIPDPNARETFLRSKLDWSMPAVGAHARWLVHYRGLLALRHRAIVPLLAGAPGGSGRYTTCGDGAVVVEWTLGRQRRLEIRLNLSGREAQAPRPPEGEALHCEPRGCAEAFAAGRLPPAAAACYLTGAAA
jgi:1,4-alpha-glucan branching enzyme